MSSPNPLSADGEPSVHNGASGLGTLFKGRAYQLEMLEESMRRNIIVAVLFPRSLGFQRLIYFRWTLVQERRLCIASLPCHHHILTWTQSYYAHTGRA